MYKIHRAEVLYTEAWERENKNAFHYLGGLTSEYMRQAIQSHSVHVWGQLRDWYVVVRLEERAHTQQLQLLGDLLLEQLRLLLLRIQSGYGAVGDGGSPVIGRLGRQKERTTQFEWCCKIGRIPFSREWTERDKQLHSMNTKTNDYKEESRTWDSTSLLNPNRAMSNNTRTQFSWTEWNPITFPLRYQYL